LFYTHDAKVAVSGVARDANGRYSAVEPIEDPVGIA
jgi:hypothetical protein